MIELIGGFKFMSWLGYGVELLVTLFEFFLLLDLRLFVGANACISGGLVELYTWSCFWRLVIQSEYA